MSARSMVDGAREANAESSRLAAPPEPQPVVADGPTAYPCRVDCPGFKRNAMYGKALGEKQQEIVALEQRIANQRNEITRLEAGLHLKALAGRFPAN